MSKMPYVGFGSETLNKQSKITIGQIMRCPCGHNHMIRGCIDEHGIETDMLLAYTCEGKSYMAGIAGRCIFNVPPNVSSNKK